MINIYFKDGINAHVLWEIKKGACGMPDDLSRAQVFVWLISNDDKINVTRWTDTKSGSIDVNLSAIEPDVVDVTPGVKPCGCPKPVHKGTGLPANVYSLKAVWYKDGKECKMAMSEVRNAFAVTNYLDEATKPDCCDLTIHVKSCVASYGYDGMSAFELACMHGVTTYTSEVEWCRFRGVENILLWLEVNQETNDLEAWWADNGDLKNIWMDKDGCVWVALTDGCTCKKHEDGWTDVLDYDRRVVVNSDLENEVCPVILEEGNECTVLYENAGDEHEYTVSIADMYKTPDDEPLVLVIPPAGYAEVNYLMSGGVIFARGC